MATLLRRDAPADFCSASGRRDFEEPATGEAFAEAAAALEAAAAAAVVAAAPGAVAVLPPRWRFLFSAMPAMCRSSQEPEMSAEW